MRTGEFDDPYLLRMTARQTATALQNAEAALARERRASVRKRLIAVRAVIEGQSFTAAACGPAPSRTALKYFHHVWDRDHLRSKPPSHRRAESPAPGHPPG